MKNIIKLNTKAQDKIRYFIKKINIYPIFNQLKLVTYISGLSTLKFGAAPPLDHNSYQKFIL